MIIVKSKRKKPETLQKLCPGLKPNATNRAKLRSRMPVNNMTCVDLGLSVKWATMNVGATRPEEYGDYYAWGETEAKSDYSYSTYKHMQSGRPESKYINKYQVSDFQFSGVWYNGGKYKNHDGKTILDAADDVATMNCGNEWRMPTIAEWQELHDNTTSKWTDDYNGTGVKGYVLTSTKEGYTDASIFLPAAGYRKGSDGPSSVGSDGSYWSSSLDRRYSCYACNLIFTSRYFGPWGNNDRCYGYSVRPVCPDVD